MENLTKSEGRKEKLVAKGTFTFSFGQNGPGLSDELIRIGELIKLLSKENHIHLTSAFIDSLDDVYDLTFEVTPHQENEYLLTLHEFSQSETD